MTTTDDTDRSYAWPLVTATRPPLLSELVEPVGIFDKLVRELAAAQVLVSMSATSLEQRRAALDGLALARDVLADARQLLDTQDPAPVTTAATPPGFTDTRAACACGEVELEGDVVELWTEDGTTHAAPACLRRGDA